ncbi:MAG: hypothetical protein AOA66_0894 [Candidatus Bathyarchaeota archaeon BA2]|nr:MAG: hypothetical protein AOA66_0894 [Candidatus Bathyarchaeota archaeon BA2]
MSQSKEDRKAPPSETDKFFWEDDPARTLHVPAASKTISGSSKTMFDVGKMLENIKNEATDPEEREICLKVAEKWFSDAVGVPTHVVPIEIGTDGTSEKYTRGAAVVVPLVIQRVNPLVFSYS